MSMYGPLSRSTHDMPLVHHETEASCEPQVDDDCQSSTSETITVQEIVRFNTRARRAMNRSVAVTVVNATVVLILSACGSSAQDANDNNGGLMGTTGREPSSLDTSDVQVSTEKAAPQTGAGPVYISDLCQDLPKASATELREIVYLNLRSGRVELEQGVAPPNEDQLALYQNALTADCAANTGDIIYVAGRRVYLADRANYAR
ncbi:MAG: hypothetical protein LH624_09515 [Cryobacterium sp.]|nr:hypothetical protein [Cryobacterium sp.]